MVRTGMAAGMASSSSGRSSQSQPEAAAARPIRRSRETRWRRCRNRRSAPRPSAHCAAIARLIAMRWSPWLSTSPPCRPPPVIDGAVGRLVDLGAQRAQAGGHGRDAVGFLDPQLGGAATPRSCRPPGQPRRTAPGTRRSCPAPAPPARRCRAAAAWRTRRSATGSPPCSPGFSSPMSAPIRRSAASRPVRRGFMPTAAQQQVRARHDAWPRPGKTPPTKSRPAPSTSRGAQSVAAAQTRLRRARTRSASRRPAACVRCSRGSGAARDAGLALRIQPGQQHAPT